MSATAPTPPEPARRFLTVLVVTSAVIAGVVGYFGVTGELGGGIPGTKAGGNAGAPSGPTCEGAGAGGNLSLQFVAGASSENGYINFNGTTPGPCVLVARDSQITVNFSVSGSSPLNHSWVLVNASANDTALPAFPGAGFSNATRFSGLAPGSFAVFHFDATRSGSFRYICEVSGHEAAGMWGWFNVTAPAGS